MSAYKPVRSFTFAILLAVFLCNLTGQAQTATPISTVPAKYVDGQVLVKFKQGTHSAVMRSTHMAMAGNVIGTFAGSPELQLVKLPAATNLSGALAGYRANRNVLYAEPNYILHALQTPNDPLFSSQWGLLNIGQLGGVPGADIKASQAWSITTGSANVVIAVLDTGVDYNHPDLAANIFTGPICPGGVVCHGINAVPTTGTDPNDPLDDNGHGTHVSGTIGALGNNALGVTGVNWNVTILPCKFLDSTGFGDSASAIRCLDFIKSLKDGGMNIVATNNSWGGGLFSQALQDAIDRQRQSGILFIAAAGNDFQDTDVLPSYPSSFPLPNIISVAATDRNDLRAFFSNVGRHTVHIGAPGQDILSTFLGGGYASESGTSMATPHVSGVAALLAAQDSTRDWRAIKNLILAGGDANADLSKTITGKRLNAFGAMTCSNQPLSGRLLPTTDVVSGSAGVPIALAELNINCAAAAGPVQVTVSPGNSTIILTDDGLGSDVAAGDGVYTGSFTPPSTGVYTLTFSTGEVVSVQVLTNYQPVNTSFNYRAIAGTSLNLGDEDVAQVNTPFPVAFGNGQFNKMWVSSNGIISFSSAVSSYVNGFLPTASSFLSTPLVQANALIAPFWDDLFPIKGTAQNVFWDVQGTAPNRELIVEWRDVRAFDCNNEQDTVKFQVVFFEASSDVLFNYADAVFGGSCTAHDFGGSATVGVQISPSSATLWGFDGQEVGNGTALLWHTSDIVFAPTAPVVTSISPTSVEAYGPDFVLTVNGSNFFPDTKVVRIGGFDRVTTFVSSTQLTAQISSSDIDLFQIFTNTMFYGARNSGPTATNFSDFNSSLTITNPPDPVVTSASPAAGTANGFAFLLTVNGDRFTPASVVNFNGQPVQTEAMSKNQLLATVPGAQVSLPQTAIITVTNIAPGGGISPAFAYPVGTAPPVPPQPVQGSFLMQHGTTRAPLVPNAKQFPKRFFGWNNAQAFGPDYLQQFTRPYGSTFTASGSDKPFETASTRSIGAAIVPPLVGLDLRGASLAGFMPTGVVAADFNRDGHVDWIVSNGGSNDLWFYEGNGDGTSKPPRIIPLIGQTPVQIIAADLRGIGVLDLILAEPDSISVGVLLGNGDGTFGPETLYFAPAPVLSVAVGDFNGDHHLDIVAGMLASNQTGGIAFFAGDGTGRVSAPVYTPVDTIFETPIVAVGLAVGDLNGDGIPDLAVVDQNLFDPGVYAYFAVGDGTFKPGPNLGGIMNAAIGDLNGDGCNDVVALDSLGIVDVSVGHCDGTFTQLPAGFEFGEGESAVGIALADVNGDGNLDLITSGANILDEGGGFGQESGALVSVLLGDGTGAFRSARVFRAQSGMFALAVGDLNGDLHPDIIVPSQDTDSVSVLLNDGTGNFGGPQGQYIGWNEKGNPVAGGAANAPVAAYLADVDGDGRLDIVAADVGQFFELPTSVSVNLNDGAGNFLPDVKTQVLEGAFQFGDLALGDFRKTGKPDMIVVPSQFTPSLSGNFYNFVPNAGSGHFGQAVTTRMSHPPGTLAVGDFNGDGNLDFVTVGFSSVATPPEQISTFLGNGDGTFREGPTQLFTANFPPGAVYVGDFNGDGKLDVMIAINLGSPAIPTILEFLGNGDGSFAPARQVITAPPTGTGLVSNLFNVADVNHDGRTDLIELTTLNGQTKPVFNIFLAQPDGSFLLANSYAPYAGTAIAPFGASLQFSQTFVADFNGDGNVDIASLQQDPGSPGTKYVQFLLGNGDGTFVPTFTRYPLGINANAAMSAIAGDMNGDGRADFVELDGLTSAFNVIHTSLGSSLRLQFLSLPVIGSNGTVRASLALPAAADTTVLLTASDPAVTLPPSIVIPAGALSQDANVQVGPLFDRSKTFEVVASAGTESNKAQASVATIGGSVGLIVALTNAPFVALLPGQSSGNLGLTLISRGGYQTTASLRCDGLPTGAACQFGNTSLSIPSGGSNATSLVVSTATQLPVGIYPFQIVASDNAISQPLTVNLKIGDFAITLSDSSAVALPTGFASIQLIATSVNSFSGVINLSCSGLPAGAICGQSTALVGAAGANSAGVLVNTNSVPVGNYPFTITGNTASTTHSVDAILHVGDFGAAAITPATASLTVGQSANFALSINAVNGFSGSLQLFCNATIGSRFATGVQCTFSPQTATFDATGKLTSQLTVAVTARPASVVIPAKEEKKTAHFAFMYFLLPAAVVLLGLRKTRKQRVISSFAVLVVGISLIISCSGGGSAGGGLPTSTPTPVPTPTPATGPQSVTITVSGTSTSQQSINRELGSVSITVQ